MLTECVRVFVNLMLSLTYNFFYFQTRQLCPLRHSFNRVNPKPEFLPVIIRFPETLSKHLRSRFLEKYLTTKSVVLVSLFLPYSFLKLYWLGGWFQASLHKIPKIHLISWCANFVERDSFPRVLGDLQEPLRKLSLSTIFPNREIR